MKRIFLSSLFSQVRGLFENYAGDSLAGKRVAFIPTAARHETINFYVKSGMKALEKSGLIVDVLDVSTAPQSDISRILTAADVIYISGGNTFFLLQELNKSGAGQMIIDHIEAGKLYIGESAGSVILAPDIGYVKSLDDCRAARNFRILRLSLSSISIPCRILRVFRSKNPSIKSFGTTAPHCHLFLLVTRRQFLSVTGHTR